MVSVRFEVFTVVPMKNAVLWDIETTFLPHRRHLRYTAQPVNGMYGLRFSQR
jgi:hypothetical protein